MNSNFKTIADMKKIYFLFILALLPMVASSSVKAGVLWYNLNAGMLTANEKISGKCGKNVYYVYNKETHALTISGEGQIYDFDPNDVEYAPWYRYAGDIHSLVIESGVTGIGNYAFFECSNLNSVTIPNSVSYIGRWAFCGCSSLTTMTIPNSVEKIDWMAFMGCSSMTSLTIGNSVTDLSEDAFDGCTSLTSIKVADGNPKYDSRNNCIALIETSTNTLIKGCNNTVIPNSVSSIGGGAFSGCTGLTSVTIPNSLTSIGGYAFSGCSGLTSVIIPNSVKSIGGGAFDGTAWLANQPDGLVYAGKVVYKYKGEMPANTQIVIEDGTLGITEDAFSNCSGLASVIIPNSVESIGSSAFKGCIGLSCVIIPNSVTFISNYIFSGCSGMSSLIIPNSVTAIGDGAFWGCNGLSSVTIPNGVTAIGSYAFAYCSGLSSVVIPNSVTTIGFSAFVGCNLDFVTIGKGVTNIGKSAFGDRWADPTNVISTIKNPFAILGVSYGDIDSEFSWSTFENGILYVPAGTKEKYMETQGWNEFQNIKEFIDGDVNLDEKINSNDVNALVDHIMGNAVDNFYEGLSDLNGDNHTDAADVVKLIDTISSYGLGTESQLDFDNVGGNLVVSSLSCTLTNDREKAIQLTKCELYCNGNLVSYKNFSGSSSNVASGGSKSCSFDNLARFASSTGFTVSWHYTDNGESYVYRCPLTD